jgi:hypothetical protein
VSGDQPPPPGWGEPEVPPPGWRPGQPEPGWGQFAPQQQPGWPAGWQPGYPPQAGWQPYPQVPPYLQQAAHKPGAIPLRPLRLGDLFDGAFRIIRYNPQATIGAAVLVSAVATLTHDQVVGMVTAFGGLLIGGQLRAIGLLYVSGMVAHVTSAAAVGRTLTIGEAWEATRGKRWRLLGMAFLLGMVTVLAISLVAGVIILFALNTTIGATLLAGFLLVPLLIVFYFVFSVRVRLLAVPALMLEPAGVFGAISRAVRLSSRQFWRLLGLSLLTGLVVAFAGAILGAPFSIAGQLMLSSADHGLPAYVLLTSIGTVITSAVLQPFSAAVSALLYVDQRIRKEAYDVELLTRAGVPVA